MKQVFDEEETKKESLFIDRIKEEEQQEKEILNLAHQSQLERAKVSAEEAIQVLIQQHQQKEKTLTEAHKQNLQVIHNSYWKDVYGTILNHQDTYHKLIERHHNEYLEFLIKMQEEEDSLYSTQILEIEEVAKDQSLPDTEEREYYDTIFTFQDYVKKQHIDQMRELMTIHKEELTTLKKNQKLQRQEVKKMLRRFFRNSRRNLKKVKEEKI